MSIKAIPLFSGLTRKTIAYYSLPDGSASPNPYGDIGAGEVVEILGATAANPTSWVQIQRKTAKLYAPLKRNDIVRSVMEPVTGVSLINSGLEQQGDEYVAATLYNGVEIRSEPDGSANVVASLPAGTVLHVTRSQGVGAPRDGYVEIRYIDVNGLGATGYVDTINAGKIPEYRMGTPYTQWLPLLPDTWAGVPLIGTTEESDEEPADTGSGETGGTVSPSVEEIVAAAAQLVKLLCNYRGTP
jgi:hypothetical protein